MKYGIVEPANKKYYGIDGEWADAMRAAKLTPSAIDHGTVKQPTRDGKPGVSIAVFELSMFLPPQSQSYFSIAGRLYAGNAVLYGYDVTGATVDVPPIMDLPFLWLRDQAAVETAIAIGTVKRPRIGVTGDTLWQWPGPRPSEAEFLAFNQKHIQAALAAGNTVLIDGDTTITVLDDKAKK